MFAPRHETWDNLAEHISNEQRVDFDAPDLLASRLGPQDCTPEDAALWLNLCIDLDRITRTDMDLEGFREMWISHIHKYGVYRSLNAYAAHYRAFIRLTEDGELKPDDTLEKAAQRRDKLFLLTTIRNAERVLEDISDVEIRAALGRIPRGRRQCAG
jgi:hypothetical protein